MILVTGGTGLLGAHLLYKLVSNNESVRAIYRQERKLENVKKVFSFYTHDVELLVDKIEWYQCNLTDVPSLTDAFAGVKRVYHCAAFVSFEPDKYTILRQTNIEGTANIVNLCLTEGVEKLCYVSSIATIGETLNNALITETIDWNPEADNSVYGITKYGAEMEVWRGTQEGLDAVIVNPGVILGGGIWRHGSGNIFKRAKKGVGYYTQGMVGLVDVQDVVDVMVLLLTSSVKNERFILVSENWTYKRFLQTVANEVDGKIPKKMAKPWLLNVAWRLDWLKHKLTGKRRQLTKHIAQALISETVYSNDKIKETLGFEFKPVDESIKVIAAQFRQK